MKEYLVKDPETGRYWNTFDKNERNIVCEIPEGAEVFVIFDDDIRDYCFYKENYTMGSDERDGGNWWEAEITTQAIKHRGGEIVWQRQEIFIDESGIINEGMKASDNKKHPHYFKDVSHLDYIDVYRVLDLFGVVDHTIGHAIKKLLCAGVRGAKNADKDIQEAIDTLIRHQEMRKEDENE